jgi:hypothetical protein
MRFPRSTPWGWGMGLGGQQPHRPSVLGGVVGGVVLPDAPDDADPGASQDAHGLGVSAGALEGLGVDAGRPWGGVAGVVGEVDDRVAQLLSQAQRKPTERSLPEARVTGATPARAARASSSGKRARTSPISLNRAAARTPWPALGRLVKIGWSAWTSRRSMISASSSRSRSWQAWMASSRACTHTARPVACSGLMAATGAVLSRASSTATGCGRCSGCGARTRPGWPGSGWRRPGWWDSGAGRRSRWPSAGRRTVRPRRGSIAPAGR